MRQVISSPQKKNCRYLSFHGKLSTLERTIADQNFLLDQPTYLKERGRPAKSSLTTDECRTPQKSLESVLGCDQDGRALKATGSKNRSPISTFLPPLRDHTSNQLNDDLDEFLPKEFDQDGEKKVSPVGEPLGGRQFEIQIFQVAQRGEKRFMLATGCARVLGYKDSYSFFNKNKSLHKIIATQQEKDDLVDQNILPYSYRSRQIAIVTAKSVFRQFGAGIIKSGRRVRDDY